MLSFQYIYFQKNVKNHYLLHFSINNKSQLMQYSKNINQSRAPIYHTPSKKNLFVAQKQQNFGIKTKQRWEDTDLIDPYSEMQYRRSNKKCFRKNIYQNQNADSIRRPKQYFPLSKIKSNVDEQVLKKSREYVNSTQFNNYVNAVKSSSKNREDLIENMKKARTNNIYLPITQEDMHKPILTLKSHQRRPIFNKNNIENGDLFASFDLTIDHLSKIDEQEGEKIQRKYIGVAEQKENTYKAANINTKCNQHAILIKDETADQCMNKLPQKYQGDRTPPINRSPIFAAINKQNDNILKIHEQNSMTKRKKTVIYTPTKSYANCDSSAKFVDYEEVQWLKMKHERSSKSKYKYLPNQNARYQVQNERSYKKTTMRKITQSQFSSTAYQNSLPTAKNNSIYDVDFKLQRPTGNSISQSTLKKQEFVQRQINQPQKKEVFDLKKQKQNRSNSRSHSKGKLSVVSLSKYTHFH